MRSTMAGGPWYPAGQVIGHINQSRSACDVMEELVTGYVEAIERLQALTPASEREGVAAAAPRRAEARPAKRIRVVPCRLPSIAARA